ncbi:UPF0104 family protein [Hoeflea sp. YIM 152468]|uniref:UPF0104 family protein n=1 Tax=Hoeflea sp. YIM 152468 TaxID=3031759 RepID=UPI0023DC790F|nr:UPF0104 family protein [Hoeflea sp. YIM 152468]MDF1609380.1 UPF0104 family protein [Hoeflea sp. YIM 152468]
MTRGVLVARAVTVIAVVGGSYLLFRNLGRYSVFDLLQSIYAIPLSDGLTAFGFVMLSYLTLAGFDATALAYVGKRVAGPRVLLTSFTALSIGHNVGVSLLSSGAVRYRFYSRWGLNAVEVGQLIVFCGVTVALGIASLAGITMLIPLGTPRNLGFLDPQALRLMGALILVFPLSYVLAARFLPRRIHVWRWHVRVPGWRLALMQVIVGTINFNLVAASLYFLLKGSADVHFLEVARGYAVANVLAIISHVPGGLGVLEAGLVYALPGEVPFGVLIAFRIVYFLIPLSFGLPLLLLTEAAHLRRKSPRHQSCQNASSPSAAETENAAN